MKNSRRGNASKPLSLHPLKFEAAMKALIDVDPADLVDEDESPEQLDRPQSKPHN